MILSNAAIRNRTTVFVIIIMIVFAGVTSYMQLPRESAPDVTVPNVMVTTYHEGVSPEEIESSITSEIEQELSGLKGMKEFTSTSSEGLSLINIEFLPEMDIDDALQRVKDKVDLAKPELPRDAEEPVVTEINISELPIIMINVSGPISPVRLKALAEELQDRIESVPGVLRADVSGALEREIRVEIDQDLVAAYGLTVGELLERIPAENLNVSAGGLETDVTKFNVRVPAEFDNPADADNLLLTVRNGRPIWLSDVAEVRDWYKDRLTYARLDGEPSITVAVSKRTGENIVYIAEAVKEVLDAFRPHLPKGVKLAVISDQSDDINDMVADLENNVATALILVVGVLMLFMGLRSSLLVALAIPLSMLLSFTVLQVMGVTLNMVVLFSLILALGMLVDNAIVIVENIYRHREMGYAPVAAAMKGTGEVAWPVISSTATTLAAFSPMLFWPGIMGEFMSYLPLTVIVVLSSSLFVALAITPVTCSLLLRNVQPRKAAADETPQSAFVRGYRKLLTLAIRRRSHRLATITLAVLVLVGVGIVFGRRNYGVELFPDIDPKQGLVNIRAPQGTNIRETDRLARLAERRIENYRRMDGVEHDVIEHVVTTTGSEAGHSLYGGDTGPHVANLQIIFRDFEEREIDSDVVLDKLRKEMSDIAGAEIKVDKPQGGPPTGAPVSVRIIGEDLDRLEQVSEQAKDLIRGIPGLVNLRSDLVNARPELVFRVDRRRAMLTGVNTMVIGQFLKTAVLGSKVSDFRDFSDEYDITVRLPERQREDINDLLRLRVPNNRGKPVPLSSLGHFEYAPGLGTIHRIDEKRVVTLSADAEGRQDNEVLADVMQWLSPTGYTRVIKSDVSDWQKLGRAVLQGRQPGASAGVRFVYESLAEPEGLLAGLSGQAPPALAAVEAAAAGAPLTDTQKKDLLAGLNRLIEEEPFYAPGRFEPRRLGEQARALAAKAPADRTPEEAERLNRLALEAALGGVIAPRRLLELPEDMQIRYAGQREEQEEAMAFLLQAFAIAVLLIVAILVTQFNTLSAPLIIISTVVLSTVGVLVGLLLLKLPFGVIMTGVGVVSLAGVVVNNAIVLLDYTRQLQRGGLDVVGAAIEAGVTRLRPVLLTATTTILGLIPMIVGVSLDVHDLSISWKSESSQYWRSMATAVVFGLTFATVLTLVVVPSFYVSFYRLAERFGFGGLRHAGEEIDLLHGPDALPAATKA